MVERLFDPPRIVVLLQQGNQHGAKPHRLTVEEVLSGFKRRRVEKRVLCTLNGPRIPALLGKGLATPVAGPPPACGFPSR